MYMYVDNKAQQDVPCWDPRTSSRGRHINSVVIIRVLAKPCML